MTGSKSTRSSSDKERNTQICHFFVAASLSNSFLSTPTTKSKTSVFTFRHLQELIRYLYVYLSKLLLSLKQVPLPNTNFDISNCYPVTVNLLIQVPFVSFGASAYMQEEGRRWRQTVGIWVSVRPLFSCVTWPTV